MWQNGSRWPFGLGLEKLEALQHRHIHHSRRLGFPPRDRLHRNPGLWTAPSARTALAREMVGVVTFGVENSSREREGKTGGWRRLWCWSGRGGLRGSREEGARGQPCGEGKGVLRYAVRVRSQEEGCGLFRLLSHCAANEYSVMRLSATQCLKSFYVHGKMYMSVFWMNR